MPVEPPIEAPNKPPDNLDRFRPAMPQIPGVNDARPGASSIANDANTKLHLQLGGLAAAMLVVGIAMFWWAKSASQATQSASSQTTVSSQTAPGPLGGDATVQFDDGPTVAATSKEVAKPWSAKKFTFVKPLSHENLAAMVIRLPGGGLWAFALREPYGHCDLEFVTDLIHIAKQYGYRASHPMVASPCTNTVYDPLKIGALGGNVWVRGDIVQGGGLRPPISIEVIEKGSSIIADRIE